MDSLPMMGWLIAGYGVVMLVVMAWSVMFYLRYREFKASADVMYTSARNRVARKAGLIPAMLRHVQIH